MLERCLLALGTKRHSFPRFLAVACLNALGTSCMFSGVFSIGYIYIHTCTNCIFSRSQHWLHICLAHGPVTYFPTLGTTRSCISVSAQHCLHIFYALGTISIFSRACQWLHIFLPLALVVSLSRLREGYVTLPFRDLIGSLGRIGLDWQGF